MGGGRGRDTVFQRLVGLDAVLLRFCELYN